MVEKRPIVVMKGITIEFPGVKALDGVDLNLYPGEVHALMGENGAGKSTLIKALTGVNKINAGTITVDGKPVTFSGTADAQDSGVATVYQEVNLCTNITIGENVMLGHEVHGPLGINWKKTHAQARTHLAKLGLQALDPRAPLSSISIAMQQLVAISRAMVVDAKVLILDEPTSSLDAQEVEHLFEIMRKLRDEGVAILFVSHFLDQVYEISDRMTILRNGQFIEEVMTKDCPRVELISKMIGKTADQLSQISAKRTTTKSESERAPLVSVKGIARSGEITPIDVKLYPGEIMGFAGLLGSGRSELGRLLFGADKPDHGEYVLDGNKVSIDSPYEALKKKVAYSTENRRDEGIIGDLTVRENIILALQATRGWMRPISRKEQDEIAAKYINELNIRPPDPNKQIKNLSGGNQQKVLLARWLATQPKVLILDEPTRGIDIGAKAEIQRVVIELADQGIAVVFISSELEEVVRLCDDILVLKDRKKIADLKNDATVTQSTIVDVIANSGEEA